MAPVSYSKGLHIGFAGALSERRAYRMPADDEDLCGFVIRRLGIFENDDHAA
jgi:hypothetical protein